MSEAHANLLIKKGIKSHSLFAFIPSYQPGLPDESPFFDALKHYLGEDPKDPLPAFRGLFYPSPTLTVQKLKDRYEPVRRQSVSPWQMTNHCLR